MRSKFAGLIIMMFASACNPFPKKDNHPEVPLISDLLKDQRKFKLVTDMQNLSEIIFLEDDRIFLKPDRSDAPFKIIDVNQGIIFEKTYDWDLPFFIDKKANLYFNRKKYFYPDYRKSQDFKNVVFKDSLSAKSEELNIENDSLKLLALHKYETTLLKRYGYKPCEYVTVHQERCNIFEIKDETLFVRNDYLFNSEFSRTAKDVKKFDDDVLIRWQQGTLPSPVYMYYYKLGDLKFKGENLILPQVITLHHIKYLYSPDFGLYRIIE